MAERAHITPKVLKWARESAKISPERAAAKVAVPIDRLFEWEEGNSYPTIRQAKLLAKMYKRPFAVLFLPDIPDDFQPLQDFRKKGAKELTTASLFIIREIQQKQSWIREYRIDNQAEKLTFVGKFTRNDDPASVARDILKTLEITPPAYHSSPLAEWIHSAERKGIFVSRTSFIHPKLKIDPEEIQGFAIADKYAPFVFINSNDWKAAQLFTLVHELAHIWINQSGISNEIESLSNSTRRNNRNNIELFCNDVAANALMPSSFVNSINPEIFSDIDGVFKLAKDTGVSTFALLIRALNLNIITPKTYKQLKRKAEDRFSEHLARKIEKDKNKKKGGPSFYLLRLLRNGREFSQIVLDAYHEGGLEPTQVSSLLNVKVNKLQNLEAQMYK